MNPLDERAVREASRDAAIGLVLTSPTGLSDKEIEDKITKLVKTGL